MSKRVGVTAGGPTIKKGPTVSRQIAPVSERRAAAGISCLTEVRGAKEGAFGPVGPLVAGKVIARPVLQTKAILFILSIAATKKGLRYKTALAQAVYCGEVGRRIGRGNTSTTDA